MHLFRLYETLRLLKSGFTSLSTGLEYETFPERGAPQSFAAQVLQASRAEREGSRLDSRRLRVLPAKAAEVPLCFFLHKNF